MRFQGICYRAHDPRWAISPTSGDGAAIRGARFNPKGVPALYLSTSIEGAITEASQGFGHKIHPLTICSYDIDCGDIADLTVEASRQELGISLDVMGSAWAIQTPLTYLAKMAAKVSLPEPAPPQMRMMGVFKIKALPVYPPSV